MAGIDRHATQQPASYTSTGNAVEDGKSLDRAPEPVMVWQYMKRFIEPHDGIKDVAQRNQMRLFAAILSFTVPIGIITVASIWFREGGETWEFAIRMLGISVIALLIPVAKGHRYRLAVVSFIAISTLLLFFIVFSRPMHAAQSSVFLVIPVLIASVFLGSVPSAVTWLINLVAVIAMGTLSQELEVLLAPRVLSFHLVVSGIAVAAGVYQEHFAEQKRADLAHRERRHRALLIATFAGTADIQDDKIVDATEGFTELFGVAHQNGQEIPITTFFPADQMATIADIQAKNQERVVELRGLRSDGMEFPIEAVFHRQLTDSKGTTLLAVRDISKQREGLARMAVTDRMAAMGTLATGISHEINNPLTYAGGNLKWAIEQLEDGNTNGDMSEIQERLKRSFDGVERIGRIVRDLTSFTPTNTLETAGLACTNVESVLDTSISLTFSTCKHRAKLVRDVEPNLMVTSDASQLSQVLVNLILNAAEAMPEDNLEGRNEIRIISYEDQNDGVIEIADNGSGIPPNILPRIFDPFYTTKPVGVGTGLGLFICKNIVDRMNGTLELETGEQGTLFRVRLPLDKTPDEIKTPTQRLPPVQFDKRRAILIVDDEEAIGMLLQDMLNEHEVDVALDGNEALQRMQTKRYAVILCDLMMPKMTGMDLYRTCLEMDPSMASRFIFLSGGAVTTAAKDFLKYMKQPRLDKPFTFQDLRATVKAHLQLQESNDNAQVC